MGSLQLALDLAPPRRFLFSNFHCLANDPVVETLRRGLEPGGWYLVAGPPGSGRTHLIAAVFNQALQDGQDAQFLPCSRLEPETLVAMLGATTAPLLVIDDVDLLAGDERAEEALFHALNRWKASRATVVMAGAGRDRFRLPDLRSRLGSATRLTLKAPNDRSRARILEGMAAEMEIELRPRARDYLISHGPRNLGELARLLEALRERAFAERRRVTVPLVREVIGKG